ncbi:hypothetical protein PFISCL1PPCAC_14846, partial [Pristionchus fissidentatus]
DISSIIQSIHCDPQMESTTVCFQVLTSCVGCVTLMEKLRWSVGETANLVTLFGMILMVSEGLVTGRFDLTRRKIPLRTYVSLVIIYFLSNSANNLSLLCKLPYPVFIIFRSASLPANLIVSFTLRRHLYSLRQVVAVSVISIGVFLFTLGTWRGEVSVERHSARVEEIIQIGDIEMDAYVLGVILLVFSLLLSAYLGIKQEELYRDYGRDTATESMYYINLLTLPFMLLHSSDINRSMGRLSLSPPIDIPFLPTTVPIPWAWAVLGLITVLQYSCISGVFRLSSMTSSLTTTVVLTLRKFVSLALSIILFGTLSSLTSHHTVGTALVVVGSLIYSPLIFK